MVRLLLLLFFLFDSTYSRAEYGIRTHENRYISPHNGYDFQQVLHLGPWESFDLESHTSSGDFLGFNRFFIRSLKGVYIGVENDRVFQTEVAGPWEEFELIHLPDGKYGFKNIAYGNFLSFKNGGLSTAPHLKHWEAFSLEWVDPESEPLTEVYLIKGRIPNTPALHGGLMFKQIYPPLDQERDKEAHFGYKNTMWGGDGAIWGYVKVEGRVLKHLGDIHLTRLEALEWSLEWAKTKKYKLVTFNCWKLPIAFSKHFALRKVDEPMQNDLLDAFAFSYLGPKYLILKAANKI